MPERDGYIPGVPCWVDTEQPDAAVAADFYHRLFGWEVEDAMPPGADGHYFIGRIRGGDVAAIASQTPETRASTWNTYVWVDDVDASAAVVKDAGGTVLAGPFDVMDAGRMAVVSDTEGAAVVPLAGTAAPRRPRRERTRFAELQRTAHPRCRRPRKRSTARCSGGRHWTFRPA